MDPYYLQPVFPNINQTALKQFDTIRLEPFKTIYNNRDSLRKPLTLRRCSTRISEYVGKYSFYYHYNDMLIPDRIFVLDYGTDLYDTPRGRRRLYREIRKDGATVHVSF